MSTDEPDDPFAGGPSMSADGKLERRIGAVESSGPPQGSDEPLELAERAPKVHEPAPASYRPIEPDRVRSTGIKVAIALGVLALGLLGVFLFAPREWLPKELWPQRQLADGVQENSPLDTILSGGPAVPLIIDSTPPGATITVGGKVVGVTPWAGDNGWSGEVPVSLSLPGYKPWKGTLQGGVTPRLDAKLSK